MIIFLNFCLYIIKVNIIGQKIFASGCFGQVLYYQLRNFLFSAKTNKVLIIEIEYSQKISFKNNNEKFLVTRNTILLIFRIKCIKSLSQIHSLAGCEFYITNYL